MGGFGNTGKRSTTAVPDNDESKATGITEDAGTAKASNTDVDGGQIIVEFRESGITREAEISTGTAEDKLTRKLEAAGAPDVAGNTERAEEPHWTPVMGIIEEPDPVELNGRSAT